MSILKTSKPYSKSNRIYSNTPQRIYEPLGDLSLLVNSIIQKQFNLEPPDDEIMKYINKLITVL